MSYPDDYIAEVNARRIARVPDLEAEVLRLRAESANLKAHIHRMSAAGDRMDGWTVDTHEGADAARKHWITVSRAALKG